MHPGSAAGNAGAAVGADRQYILGRRAWGGRDRCALQRLEGRIEGLTRGYAACLVKDGVTVNAVAPSLIDTDMMNTRRDQYVARIPLGRMGTAEEVAQVVVMVTANEYMTGQTIQLNGGTNFI